MKQFKFFVVLLAGLVLGGCATNNKMDYSAFKESKPRSILVLPPLNNSPDVRATYSTLSQATLPLAESGYYVFPVTLVDETFKQNGVTVPADIHELPINKLREIFGADTALYMTVKEYGSSYKVVSSDARVTLTAKLVDLRTGKEIWQGSATASSAEGESNNSGLIGLLVKAVINQIVDNVSNRSHPVAGVADNRLLFAGRPNGILYGPRSPKYGTD